MFKKLLNLKSIVLFFTVVIFALGTLMVVSPGVSEVIYEKVFKGNVLHKGIIYIADHPDGNQDATTYISALPKIDMVSLGTMTNASTETVNYLDDTPTGEWTAINTRTTLTADTNIYKKGATSLAISFASNAVAGDGAIGTIGANDNLEANESIGFWIYSTEELVAGDLYIELVDATSVTDYTVNIPQIFPRKWTWVECNIAAIPGGDGDVVTDMNVKLSAAGATNHGAFIVYLDYMYKWDANDEEALGLAIVNNGVLNVMQILTGQGSNNTFVQAVEGTAYFVHYETGVDFIVGIADNSTYSGLALVAYR